LASSCHRLHMRVVGVKRALHCLNQQLLPPPHWSPGQPSGSFQLRSTAHRCRPCGVVGDALASSKRSGKSTGFLAATYTADGQRTRFRSRLPHYGDVSCGCVAIRGSSPFTDCGFDARRTSHPVAVPRTAGTTIPHSQGHRAREGGSTLYVGISQPLFATVRPPGSNGADQARGGTRDNASGLPECLSLPS
jgi:hypothetical protein